jgi:streptogramin lyase
MSESSGTRLGCVSKLVAPALLAMSGIAASHGLDLACPRADLGNDPAVIAAKADVARGRVWILAQDGLYLHQSASGAVRRFDLPNWRYVIRFACPPDLAVAPDGSVLVSSNVMASLWRIDPALGQVSQVALHFEMRAGRDFGFSAMDVSESGIVWAQDAADRSPWRIDLGTGFAAPVLEDRKR